MFTIMDILIFPLDLLRYKTLLCEREMSTYSFCKHDEQSIASLVSYTYLLNPKN